MGFVGILIMIAAGGAIAVFIMVAIAVAQRNADANTIASAGPDRSQIAASILFNLMLAGGARPDDALRDLRSAGLSSPVTTGIDIASWADRFAHLSNQEQRGSLLETAVRLISDPSRPVPVRQYAALLDLSFSLGFQTDALARLRERYGFDYIDHAKEARPREADRGGGAIPLFVREEADTAALLRILGLDEAPSRQAIISAFRRLAAQHHPDRVFGQPAEVQSRAAARFIEITRAYETLMAIYRD